MNTPRLVGITAVATIGLLAIASAALGGVSTGPVPSTLVTGTALTGTAVTGSPVSDPGLPSTAAAGVIDIDEAARIALNSVGGGQVTEIERKYGYAHAGWEVEIRNGATEHELTVDGESGAIIRHETEIDDDHDHDD